MEFALYMLGLFLRLENFAPPYPFWFLFKSLKKGKALPCYHFCCPCCSLALPQPTLLLSIFVMEPLAAAGQACLCSISLFITIIIIIPLFNIFVFHNHQYDQNQQGCILTEKEDQNEQGCILTKKI